MNVNTEYQLLHRFIRERLRDIHTVKPGVVTKVNDFTVDVKPLTTTKYRDGTQLPLPTFEDVPLMINSGGMGNARITMPIKEGDPVVVLSSDRDYDNLRSSEITKDSIFPGQEITPLSLNPIMAIPCFFTEPQGTPIDKDNVVVENGSTKITVKPDGDVDIETTANINASAEGNITATAGGDAEVSSEGNSTVTAQGDIQATAMQNITASATANFDITGSQIRLNGPVNITGALTAGGGLAVTGAVDVDGTMTATTVTNGTVDLGTHVHPGVTSGDSTTGPAQ